MNTPDTATLGAHYQERLLRHYETGFGVMPAAKPSDTFYGQVWTRDAMHASLNYYIDTKPEAFEDSLDTILRYQRPDGALPLRVERTYLLLRLIPGLHALAQPAFDLIERRMRGRHERPVWSGQDFNGAQDTIPLVLLAAQRYSTTARGESFLRDRFAQLLRAHHCFSRRFPPVGGLIELPRDTNDWADSIVRGGKLGLMNVLWAQSLHAMHQLALLYADAAVAEDLEARFQEARGALLCDIYVADEAYFRAAAADARLDTVASIIGALWFLDSADGARTQETLRKRVRRPSGLVIFDPPYGQRDIYWPFKLIGHDSYHNKYVWPWIMLQNCTLKIRIAQEHAEAATRLQYQKEAVADFYNVTELFFEAGGAYEIFYADKRAPAISRFYKPPRSFLANLATWEGTRLKLDRLGWL